MISIRLRLLYLRLSYLIGLARDCRPGMQGLMPFSIKASRNQSASYPRSPSSQLADGRPLTNTLEPEESLLWLPPVVQEAFDHISV